MKSEGSIIGGETSGHIINLDYSPTGDGLLIALLVIRESIKLKSPISELTKGLQLIPQVSIDIKNDDMTINDLTLESIASSATEKLDNGRAIIRKSGTEPLIRILIETDNDSKSTEVAEFIKEEILKEIK